MTAPRTLAVALLAAMHVVGCDGGSIHGEPRTAGAPSASAAGASKAASGRLVSVSPKLLESGRIAVATVAFATATDELTVTGEVTAPPNGAAEIGAAVGGVIREIRVKEGDVVAKGQTLATLDAAEAARTATDLGRAEARRDRARRVLSQEEQLMRGNATSERNLAEARTELAAAEAEVRGANALLSKFGAAGGGRVLSRSPIAGTVVKRSAVLGKSVETGAPLFRVVRVDELVVRADVPENDAPDVQDGTRATLAWPVRGISCTGTVESRAPSVDPATRTVPFRIRPGEACPVLVEGGFVDVTLSRTVASSERLVGVPRDAIVDVDSLPVVFVATARSGEFRPVAVRIDRISRDTAFVVEGLAPGDRVVVRGVLLLEGELMRSALE